MKMTTILAGLCVAFGAATAESAVADIAAFNAAIKANDYKTAAVEAKAIWPAFDKSDRDTAPVARMFGLASYMGGDYGAAHDFGVFLQASGASLATPDDMPATSAVLLAAADYRLNPVKGRSALQAALKAREEKPTTDAITILAAEALFVGDRQSGAWEKLESSATMAAELIGRGGA